MLNPASKASSTCGKSSAKNSITGRFGAGSNPWSSGSTKCCAAGADTIIIATAAGSLARASTGLRRECNGGCGASTPARERSGQIIRERNSTTSTDCGHCRSGPVGHSLGGELKAMRLNRPGEPDTGNPYVRFDEGRSGNAEPTTSVGSIRLFPLRLLY